MKRFSFYILLALFCSGAALGATPKYRIVDLGTLGGENSWAFSINNNGQVVGRAEDAYGLRRAVLFDPNCEANNIDLGTLPGSNGESWAYSINNLGQIVGHDYDENGMERACLFDFTGRGYNLALGSLGGTTGSAHFINDRGQIVGWSATAPDEYYCSNWHATLFDATGRGLNVDLDQSQAFLSIARTISPAGQAAGNIENSAYIFDASGQGANLNLATSLAGDYSVIMAQNASGQMVGYSNFQPGNYHRATLYKINGTAVSAIDLGTLGGTRSYATSINSQGQVTGYARTAAEVYHAVLFDASGAGANIDLNTFLDPNAGWELSTAYINDKGMICGYGTRTETGQVHAYLMVPLLPKSINVRLQVCPSVLNLSSCGNLVMCTIFMPAGYKPSSIDKASLKLGDTVGIQWLSAYDNLGLAIAAFPRTGIKQLTYPGLISLTLTGKLSDGTLLNGADTIRVIGMTCGKRKF